MRARARGAGLLVAVLVIVTVAAFAVVVGASQSGGDIQGNDALADSIEALYLAESGVERALKRYATGAANCGATAPTLQETITDLNQLGLGAASGRSIDILEGLTTDFGNVALVSSQTQCRVRVTARINASNVSRTIHAIVDRNLLQGANNHNFNNTSTAGAPDAAWTFQPANTYRDGGGPDGAFPNCRRSVWFVKTTGGGGAVTASGSTTIPVLPVPVTVAAPSTTTVHFHRRAVERGAHATCTAFAGAAAFTCAAAAGQPTTVCFRMTGTAPGSPWLSGNSNFSPTVDIGAVACPYAPNPCDTDYSPAYPTKNFVTINVAAGAPARRTVNSLEYSIRLQTAGRREIFIDNIEAVNTTALDAARVQIWRDCSAAADPATCL